MHGSINNTQRNRARRDEDGEVEGEERMAAAEPAAIQMQHTPTSVATVDIVIIIAAGFAAVAFTAAALVCVCCRRRVIVPS